MLEKNGKHTKEVLLERYDKFIWLYLEKINFYLISALRKQDGVKNEKSLENINEYTQVIPNEDGVDPIINDTILKICGGLNSYEKVLAGKIPLHNSYIQHSKLANDTLDSILTHLNRTNVSFNPSIQQEWGGSRWNIEFYQDDKQKCFIYCEEISKWKMKFLFDGSPN